MAMRYDENGNLVEIINGIRIVHTPDGLIVGEGIEAVLIRGQNLKLSDASTWIQGHYPDTYPFSAPHRHPEEDVYKDFSLNPDFPPDGIPLDRLPKIIRELKKIVAGTSSVATSFPSSVKDGDLVTWDTSKKQYVPASCPKTKADIAAGLFFNGVADLDTNTVITSSTVTHDGWNLITGQKYFLDCSKPGKLTTTDTGYFVGIAQGPHTMFFAPLADSAESLITALEQGLKAEEAARKSADANIMSEIEKRDNSLCSDIKDCILGTGSSSGSGGNSGDSGSDGIFDDIFKPGGGISKDPASGKLILDCEAVKDCILGTGSGGSGGSGSGGILDDVFSDDDFEKTATGFKIKCSKVVSCMADNLSSIVAANKGLKVVGKKLVVDFTTMSTTDLKALISSLIDPKGGLAFDPVTGKLIVDFSKMPNDRFEELKKSIQVPIWLTANKNVFVDGTNGHSTASDAPLTDAVVSAGTVTDSEGNVTYKPTRGDKNYPWKTIQAAVDDITDNYNLSTHTVTIWVRENIIYNEALVLPSYNTNTGIIHIRPWTGDLSGTSPIEGGKFTVINKTPTSSISKSGVINAIGGSYSLHRCNMTFSTSSASSTARTSICLSATGTSTVTCYGCDYKSWLIDSDVSAINSSPASKLLYYGIYVGGNATVQIVAGADAHKMESSISSNLTKTYSYYPFYLNGGQLNFQGSNDSSIPEEDRKDTLTIDANNIDTCCYVVNSGRVIFGTVGTVIQRLAIAMKSGVTASGQRYYCGSGGSINTGSGGPEVFPGATAGEADSDTYSWYK